MFGLPAGIALTNNVGLLMQDVGIFPSFAPQWGIYLNGQPQLIVDAVLSVGLRREWVLSNYPQEGGGFQTYNKVTIPTATKVRFAQGGSSYARTQFLQALDAMAAGVTLYDVVTPDEIYSNANIMHVDYERHADRGAGMITADVWLMEVRTAPSAAFTTPANSSDSAQASGGNVQAGSDIPPGLIQ